MSIYNELELDYERSKEMYELFKDKLKVKHCYSNVFYVVSKRGKLPSYFKDIKVAYGVNDCTIKGVLKSDTGIWARHCFFIKNEGGIKKVIDPTFIANGLSVKTGYIVVKEFSIDEYIDALIANDGLASLDLYLLDDFNKLALYLRDSKNAYYV